MKKRSANKSKKPTKRTVRDRQLAAFDKRDLGDDDRASRSAVVLRGRLRRTVQPIRAKIAIDRERIAEGCGGLVKVNPVLAEVRGPLVAIPNEAQHQANVGAGAKRRICRTDRA